ncbi:MAG: response regulator [Campylobacteraceae bacterium]|nr:response regulator [Campylobacteraceae bacterium]
MKNILLIDYSDIVTTALEIKLKKFGFSVYCCSSIGEAYTYDKESFIDFFGVIMEIDMPYVSNKTELVQYFLDKNYATIILSSNDDKKELEEISTLNIVDYIVKKSENDLNYAAEMMQRIYSYQDHKVLIVDDSKIAIAKAKKNLEILKLKTLIAYDGLEALKVIEKHQDISLVLTDYNMPNMNGFELTLALRKKYSKDELIIIAITAADSPKVSTMFLKYGANGYISKKCTKNELNYTINNLMDVLENKQKAIKSRQQLEHTTQQLSKYVSPQIYNSIIQEDKTSVIESKRQKLVIFFIHIDDFTTITEIFESKELTLWLNSYLSVISTIASKFGATIDKYVGDMVMGFFGAPISGGLQEDALSCMKMIIEIQKEMRGFRKKQKEDGVLHPFFIKGGISTGFVTVGNFGSFHRMDYTIIGSFVNLAARLCTAAQKNEILITQETYMLTSKYIQTKTTQKIKAKGFTKLIQTYSVTALKSEKILSSESNKLLKDILENIPSKDIKLQDEVIEFMSEIKGVNNEKLL